VFIHTNNRLQHVAQNRTLEKCHETRNFTHMPHRTRNNKLPLEPPRRAPATRLLKPQMTPETKTRFQRTRTWKSFLAVKLLCGPLLGPLLEDDVVSFGEPRPWKTPIKFVLIQSTESTEADNVAHLLSDQPTPRVHRRPCREGRRLPAPLLYSSSTSPCTATTEDKIHSGIATTATATPQ
jgi:hypothetical protein